MLIYDILSILIIKNLINLLMAIMTSCIPCLCFLKLISIITPAFWFATTQLICSTIYLKRESLYFNNQHYLILFIKINIVHAIFYLAVFYFQTTIIGYFQNTIDRTRKNNKHFRYKASTLVEFSFHL